MGKSSEEAVGEGEGAGRRKDVIAVEEPEWIWRGEKKVGWAGTRRQLQRCTSCAECIVMLVESWRCRLGLNPTAVAQPRPSVSSKYLNMSTSVWNQ